MRSDEIRGYVLRVVMIVERGREVREVMGYKRGWDECQWRENGDEA